MAGEVTVEQFPPLPENPQDGVVILSIGSGRRQWLWNAIASVRRHRPDLGVHVVSDVPCDVPFTWCDGLTGRASRWYKTRVHRLTPFPGITMLLDDDAVIHRPLPPFSEVLGSNDLALARDSWWPTVAKALNCHKTHPTFTSREDRQATEQVCSKSDPHHNSGVLFFRRQSDRVAATLDRWNAEWFRFQRCDQLPLCRALAATGIPITTLPKEYNWITSKWGRRGNPYVFHFTHKHHMGWYYEKHAKAAETHASYSAYSRAVNNGQWKRRQYEAVGRLLHRAAPANLLVWGCGHDSEMWQRLNPGGRTVFVETNPRWAFRARKLGCDVVNWNPPNRRGEPHGNDATCPVSGQWDFIVIDAPPGHNPKTPGRELPIRWAAENKVAKAATTIIIHDAERPWERWCINRYLGPPSGFVTGSGGGVADTGLLGIWSQDHSLAAELCR